MLCLLCLSILVNFYVMFFLTNYKLKLTNLNLKLINSVILQKKKLTFKEGLKFGHFAEKKSPSIVHHSPLLELESFYEVIGIRSLGSIGELGRHLNHSTTTSVINTILKML